VTGEAAGELGVGTVCTEKLDDGDLPATSWERNRVGLDEEKAQRWDIERARAEKRGGVYDERQRQDDELRLGRRLQKRGGSSSLVSQE
jgi:hypothetical protein